MSRPYANTSSPVADMQHWSWDDLRLFLAIGEGTSLRAAGRRLGLNASTVSRRLAGLEEALGVPLFERQPTGLRLTPAGKETLRLGASMEDQVRRWLQMVGSEAHEVMGRVSITSAEVIGDLTARCVADLCERYPGLQVELSISDTMKNVERHEVDIALRVADAPPEDLVGRMLGRSAVGLYASRVYVANHPAELSEPSHRFIEWPEALRHKPAFAWMDKHFPERNKVARSFSAGGVLALVRAGAGIAPLGVAQASEVPELVCLKRLPASCSTKVWALTQRGAVKSARVRASLEFLADAMKSREGQLQ